MNNEFKLHATDGMLRDIRLGKVKKIAPAREIKVIESKDKFDRIIISFRKLKIAIHNWEKESDLIILSKKISTQIDSDNKFIGAFSEKGINLYNGSYLIYSFDINGKMIINNSDIIKRKYKKGW